MDSLKLLELIREKILLRKKNTPTKQKKSPEELKQSAEITRKSKYSSFLPRKKSVECNEKQIIPSTSQRLKPESCLLEAN